MINGDERKCTGKITRRRNTGVVFEESIIDFVIACEDVADIVSKMEIDEDKKYVLARYTKTKKGYKMQESDHNSIITSIDGTRKKSLQEKSHTFIKMNKA